MSAAGVKRTVLLNVTIWWLLYIISAKISPVFADIYRIPVQIWAPWSLWGPLGPLQENGQHRAHLGPKGFHMAFESSKSVHVPDSFGTIDPFILGPRSPGGPYSTHFSRWFQHCFAHTNQKSERSENWRSWWTDEWTADRQRVKRRRPSVVTENNPAMSRFFRISPYLLMRWQYVIFDPSLDK